MWVRRHFDNKSWDKGGLEGRDIAQNDRLGHNPRDKWAHRDSLCCTAGISSLVPYRKTGAQFHLKNPNNCIPLVLYERSQRHCDPSYNVQRYFEAFRDHNPFWQDKLSEVSSLLASTQKTYKSLKKVLSRGIAARLVKKIYTNHSRLRLIGSNPRSKYFIRVWCLIRHLCWAKSIAGVV